MRKHRYGIGHGHTACLHRKALCLLSGFLLLMISTIVSLVIYVTADSHVELEFGTPDFLINNDHCKIPNVLPWNSEFKPFYEPKRPYKCSGVELLTGIEYINDQAFLYINRSRVSFYSTNGVNCCFQTIGREAGETADIKIKYSICQNLRNRHLMNTTEVVVKCRDRNTDKVVYANAHSIILRTADIKEKIRASQQNAENPPSVILLGLDSVSRLNLHRMLPKTKNYLDSMEWIEYKGYNKVGENTFPNLMALLTGRNITRVFEFCNPQKVGVLDNCNYVWKEYSKRNYVTAYIEDAINISTFTYLKKGFLQPPTDLYYKPYLTAAEDLGITEVDGMSFCSGPVSSGERILQVAKEFIVQLGDQPKFGLFWSNTFSHDDINAPARMDNVLTHFFRDVQNYLNNTVVLFFSDHGMRFGRIRQTKTGWYEERLPFAYFWIPQRLQIKFPSEHEHILRNSERLSTPYDIYMTLLDMLEIYSDSTKKSTYCDATKNCRSLFKDVGDRSCEDVGIPMHYCTCFGYKPYDTKSPVMKLAGQFAVNQLNAIISSDTNTSLKCAQYNLDKITFAQKAVYRNTTYLLFQLKTVPEAIFEFTLSYRDIEFKDLTFKVEDEISRLDKYEMKAQCVTDKKLYCYCRSNIEMYMHFFSFWFEV